MGDVATRVLVVEDDNDVRAMLRMLLEAEGYLVSEVGTAEEAWVVFNDQPIDAAMIDLKLPGMHGFELCRRMRRGSDVPIIVVTAQVHDADVVAGLEAGADDYVTKPFNPKVLTARLRALLRRTRSADSAGHLVFGPLVVVPREGRAERDGEAVALTKTEFRLLCDLAEHGDQLMTRDQLLERVWGYEYTGDGRLVDAHVRRIRSKIEADPANPQLLQTVRGLGYRLVRP
jgi:DNA-binding response OmpR family regulator